MENRGGEDRDDPGGLSPGEVKRLRRMLERLMELGIGVVYAEEREDGEEAVVDCERSSPAAARYAAPSTSPSQRRRSRRARQPTIRRGPVS
jgi:hypothetical protein